MYGFLGKALSRPSRLVSPMAAPLLYNGVLGPRATAPSVAPAPIPGEDALPPSARAVLAAVRARRGLDHRGLVEEAHLPARTVRHAVARLKSEGLVTSRVSLRDGRRSHFFPVADQETSTATS